MRPTFRALLKAASVLNEVELGEMFYLANFSLGKFLEILKHPTGENREEECLIKEVVIKYNHPLEYHLLLAVIESRIPLAQELQRSGLSMQVFREMLDTRIAAYERKLMSDNEFKKHSLVDLHRFICN
jgi:hypothetical protein